MIKKLLCCKAEAKQHIKKLSDLLFLLVIFFFARQFKKLRCGKIYRRGKGRLVNACGWAIMVSLLIDEVTTLLILIMYISYAFQTVIWKHFKAHDQRQCVPIYFKYPIWLALSATQRHKFYTSITK